MCLRTQTAHARCRRLSLRIQRTDTSARPAMPSWLGTSGSWLRGWARSASAQAIDLLARCLDALCAQAIDPATYEILVVDDDPDGSAWPVVDAHRARLSGRPALRYLTAPATQGPAAARNVGWRAAHGAVIAFTDDDTIADPAWLRHGADALLAEPGAAAAAGRIDVPLPPRPTDYERDVAVEQIKSVTPESPPT